MGRFLCLKLLLRVNGMPLPREIQFLDSAESDLLAWAGQSEYPR
jgi:hypothetical protein